jgi:hypothetical protein
LLRRCSSNDPASDPRAIPAPCFCLSRVADSCCASAGRPVPWRLFPQRWFSVVELCRCCTFRFCIVALDYCGAPKRSVGVPSRREVISKSTLLEISACRLLPMRRTASWLIHLATFRYSLCSLCVEDTRIFFMSASVFLCIRFDLQRRSIAARPCLASSQAIPALRQWRLQNRIISPKRFFSRSSGDQSLNRAAPPRIRVERPIRSASMTLFVNQSMRLRKASGSRGRAYVSRGNPCAASAGVS